MTSQRCPVCNAPGSVCGPHGTGTPIVIDAAPVRKDAAMGTKRYDVEIDGRTTTFNLSDAEAKARGLDPSTGKARGEVTNKARTSRGKGADSAKAEGKIIDGKE